MYEQQRDARCFAFGEFVPYPFQKNYRLLSQREIVEECASGLADAGDGKKADNFEAFIIQRFGKGIAHHFMLPYNRKLWGRDLKRLAADWTRERVAAPEGEAEKFDTSGGERKPLQGDTKVAYPAKGGYVEIFKALAKRISDIRYHQRVVQIDPRKRIAHTFSGETFKWERLVSSLPIPTLLNLVDGAPTELKVKAAELDYLSLKLALVVVNHPVDTEIQRVYSSEANISAHKIVISHNSSDHLRQLPHHGIMAEMSVGPDKPPVQGDPGEGVVGNLLVMGLLKCREEVRRVEIRDVKYGYPVPSSSRDAIVAEIDQWLGSSGIHSVGRFGQWAYINSDEAIFRGIQLGKRLSG